MELCYAFRQALGNDALGLVDVLASGGVERALRRALLATAALGWQRLGRCRRSSLALARLGASHCRENRAKIPVSILLESSLNRDLGERKPSPARLLHVMSNDGTKWNLREYSVRDRIRYHEMESK